VKILITGAAGMLGADLCNELKKSHAVIGLDVKKPPVEDSLVIDIANKKSLYEAIISKRPDMVAHCAAYTDVDGCELNKDKAYQINALGTKNVAEACKDIDCAMAYISTDFIFDGKKQAPYTEEDRPWPISVYGRTKLEGEEFVKALLKKYLIIRTSWTYGKSGKNFVESILASAKSGLALSVVSDQVGSPTYTIDLAQAIKKLIEKACVGSLYGVYHVTNSGSCSRHEEALKILELAGIKDVKIKPISSQEANYPAKRPKMSVLDNSKYGKLFGDRLRPWEDALKDYLKK